MTALLDVSDVTLRYKTSSAVVTATERVSFSVDRSDRFVLLGPSGCGKSTLLKAVGGYMTPSEGKMRISGREISEPGADRMMIFQEFDQLLPWKTVLENVMVGAFLRHPHRNDARDHARRIVELTGLQGEQRARSLGTPGRKRLEIARVLATDPRLLLLDESLAGLTPTELQAAIALVRRIHDMGITIVIVEHIMEVIMTLTKRVLVFNQGHVIASGTPEAVVREDAVIEAYLGRRHRRPPPAQA